MVVTHAPALVRALVEGGKAAMVELVKELGETRVAGQGRFDQPAWQWPKR